LGERFEDRWQPGQSLAEIDAYLPPGYDPCYLRALVELACRDLEKRLHAGQPARAEHYLERFPALGREPAAAAQVIATEFHRRRCREAGLTAEHYLERFPQFAAELAGHLQAGPVVPGYQILGVLGRGGMGVVYKARQLSPPRTVALKMIRDGGHAGTEALARFRTEAEAAARLQHPNIVQIYEVGEHNGQPFFSLEFCPWGSLDKKLAGTPVPPPEAVNLVQKLARAMQAAHEARVIHRDLKPANVLLAADETPKITDFGLARKLDEAGQTQTGDKLGTPSYMAPEQAAGNKEVGTAADVYALGAILYECLTGRPPFRAATPEATRAQVQEQEPVPPRRLNRQAPRDLETVCLKCLEKEPGRRYASALALA
jgi:serine/threonine protein kinase